ncbi:hypothetical protein H6P81_004021 [Aristolochia fimbriata]|uniref:Cation/H+ exchanger domain-containing protein n=1 Tax=Aristolochia fimbriata TaxID=158543 RepID=A0AAV7FHN9_ARIFI|nr:hypothetical protein H6P81_004021 [Aristolochia fimbriata]
MAAAAAAAVVSTLGRQTPLGRTSLFTSTILPWRVTHRRCDDSGVNLFHMKATLSLRPVIIPDESLPPILSLPRYTRAGIVLGPTIWASDGVFNKFVFPKDISMYHSLVGDVARVLFIFLVGLELNIPHMIQTKRLPGAIAAGAIASSLILGGAASHVLYDATDATGSRLFFALLFSALLSSTASPVTIEMCTRLKLVTSNIGRLAVSAALVNDLASLLFLSLMTSRAGSNYRLDDYFTELGLLLLLVSILIIIFRISIQILNRMYPQRKKLRRMETLWIITFVVGIVWIVKKSHYSPMVGSFFVGLSFPKDGKIHKLLVQQLVVLVHELVFPIYFGYTGASTDVKVIGKDWTTVCLIIAVAGLSTLGKMAGTVAVTSYYSMTLTEGIVLGLLLNVKAHLNIMFMGIFARRGVWSNDDQMVLLIPTLLCTVVAGPLVGWILKGERRTMKLGKVGLEYAPLEGELHIVSCIYAPRHVPAMLNLIEASRWGEGTVKASVIHLIQLTEKMATTLLYHQRPEDEDDENDEDGRHIGDAVDSFSGKTGLCVVLHHACFAFEGMHKDVCKIAEREFPSMVVVPFHKHVRVDGRIEVTNEGYQIANNKILEKAYCTVGVLLDRGFGGLVYTLDASSDPFGVGVLVVFLGGADDREAAAFAGKLAYHPRMSVVLMRFLPAAKEEAKVNEASPLAGENEEVILSIPERAEDKERDGQFLASFHERYVASGLVTYIEKRVHGGIEIAMTLSSMKGEYTLFVVGRGKHDESSTMTTGLRDFEDYSHLGPIGSLLASQEFIGQGSVLVVQQCVASGQNDQIKEQT